MDQAPTVELVVRFASRFAILAPATPELRHQMLGCKSSHRLEVILTAGWRRVIVQLD